MDGRRVIKVTSRRARSKKHWPLPIHYDISSSKARKQERKKERRKERRKEKKGKKKEINYETNKLLHAYQLAHQLARFHVVHMRDAGLSRMLSCAIPESVTIFAAQLLQREGRPDFADQDRPGPALNVLQ